MPVLVEVVMLSVQQPHLWAWIEPLIPKQPARVLVVGRSMTLGAVKRCGASQAVPWTRGTEDL
ncbi:hypothetical protein COUCH_00630 [Couchioplanes caeruleus]|uniref:hypothetical protein n=1 Tax=Couchioplanes caeruleus TaxID=56438 RepID=UPI0020BE8610|nr:hypothetical protein [Couchioplanes caeruleus]UQU64906.1 hypothetical protein COUCH_00630 [Couchioplanes caeruleus]